MCVSDIFDNFCSQIQFISEICLCGDTETLSHINSCILLNNNKSVEPFEALYNGEIKSQIKAYRRLSEALIVELEHFIE